MNIKLMRDLYEQRPFIPFTITLADGRKLEVIHNEFLAFFPKYRGAVVTHPDYRITVIDMDLVTSVDADPQFQTRPKKPASKKGK